MSKIWLVHKDGLALGPYEAVELRQQLREGALDPFDLISKQGSSIKRELVEVDEIFQTENKLTFDQESQSFGQVANHEFSLTGEYQQQDATVVNATGFDYKGEDNNTYQMESNGFHPSPIAPNAHNKITELAGAAPAVSPQFHQKVYTRVRKNPKKFQIVDNKGKVLGPLSAGEIQSLFYKGVLPSSVMVMKIGTNSSVQIEKFVTVYSEAKRKQVKQGGHPQMGMLNSKKLNQMAQAHKIALAIQHHKIIKKMTFGICVLLFIIAGVFAYRALEKRGGIRFLGFGNSKVVKTQRNHKVDRKRKRVIHTKKLPRPKTYKKEYRPVKKLSRPAKKTVKRKAIYKPKSRYVPQHQRTSGKLVRPGRPKSASLKTVRPKYSRAIKPVYLPPRAKSVPPKAVAKPPRTTVASLRPGMSVTGLGPMAFNPDSVRKCEMKCTIRMVGAGGIVNVKFFKIHYGAKLLPKARRVYISGLVQKSGGTTTVLLNGVK